MAVPKYMVVSSIVGGLVLAAGVAAVAFSQQKVAGGVPPGELQVVIRAEETDSGVCRPETIATVNKQEQGFYALYGDARYSDTRDGTSTRLPLQWVFTGWDDAGMSEVRTATGINTETACADLKIAYEIEECWYDHSNREPRACPAIHIEGDGFAEIVIEEDRSQDLPEPEKTQ
ncbi:hypothetical protein [Pelagibacterium xiamenense]|uniref:hypothetical protein n=1 Tax=Pelagibacterium xiamenense TaxID=2901140 RepID=UPI001E4B13BE|nr:hypothetical protein [Pelagibacterium xiamenense]MCD7060704.1 hypothetical protein [Pelagibacterium xiamenense]